MHGPMGKKKKKRERKKNLHWWSLWTPSRRAHLQSFSSLRRHDVYCSVLTVQAPISKPQANVHCYAVFSDVRQTVTRLELPQPVPAPPFGKGGLAFKKSFGKWVNRGNGLTLRWITCKDSLNTSQRMQTVSIIKMSRLLLFREGIDTKGSKSSGLLHRVNCQMVPEVSNLRSVSIFRVN